MPDLIIKPAAQSGNKVIIQDQAGGAVITTADSGATIANATLVTPALGTPASGVATNLTGIPAANLTGTITSGTQDAITRLGTVTSANFTNSAIVYPAGHIVQTVVQFSTAVFSAASAVWETFHQGGSAHMVTRTDNPKIRLEIYHPQIGWAVSAAADATEFHILIRLGTSAGGTQLSSNFGTTVSAYRAVDGIKSNFMATDGITAYGSSSNVWHGISYSGFECQPITANAGTSIFLTERIASAGAAVYVNRHVGSSTGNLNVTRLMMTEIQS